MKCDCMKKMKSKLKELVLNSEEFMNKDNLKVEINNKNVGLDFDTKVGVVRYSPFLTFEYEVDYTDKNGDIITKKEDMNIILNYCPFCGVECTN